MATLRRNNNPNNDPNSTKFLYIVMKQLDLKHVNWQQVADEMGISNGHAARMRYTRLKQQMEGTVPGRKGKAAEPGERKKKKQTTRNKRAKDEEEKDIKKTDSDADEEDAKDSTLVAGSENSSDMDLTGGIKKEIPTHPYTHWHIGYDGSADDELLYPHVVNHNPDGTSNIELSHGINITGFVPLLRPDPIKNEPIDEEETRDFSLTEALESTNDINDWNFEAIPRELKINLMAPHEAP